MRPQFSIIFFTTLAGMAQGLLFSLAILDFPVQIFTQSFLSTFAFPAALVLLGLGLVASFFHLGRPERAWRAAMMWRTSWLSREVIVLPMVMAVTVLGLLYSLTNEIPSWLWIAIVIATILLWICTAKIYQCIRFIQEWSHPSTLINFTLLGITSGWMLLGVLVGLSDGTKEFPLNSVMSGISFILLFVAFNLKIWIWRRNRSLRPKSNLASATGIKGTNIRQTSMGLMGGSFNTREFFHHQTENAISNIRKIVLLCAYIFPMILVAYSISSPSNLIFILALIIHFIGLLAERWMFFAEANHPQNLYYQRVS
jgi:DMSO reductase anchor subunit